MYDDGPMDLNDLDALVASYSDDPTPDPNPSRASTSGLGTYSGWADKGVPLIPRCKHDAKAVFTVRGVLVYAADFAGMRQKPEGAIVLNCTSTSRYYGSDTKVPEAFRSALAAHLDQPSREIVLDWQDGGTPPVLATFWLALVKLCRQEEAPLVIHCLGGHGRTGTALAALLIAVDGVVATEAIDRVRALHCDRAIETASQETYLEDLDLACNGREPPPKVSPKRFGSKP